MVMRLLMDLLPLLNDLVGLIQQWRITFVFDLLLDLVSGLGLFVKSEECRFIAVLGLDLCIDGSGIVYWGILSFSTRKAT